MKRPILYRVVFYSILAGLSGSTLFLTYKMLEAPFSSRNMRSAYYAGCNIEYHSPLTTNSIARCAEVADEYKNTLDDLDRQMNP